MLFYVIVLVVWVVDVIGCIGFAYLLSFAFFNGLLCC